MTSEKPVEQEYSSDSEFEREPVPQRALLGFKSFVGMYAGEHCAGTELMIGPLFIAAGVSAFDVVFGLLVGNALAVLSWKIQSQIDMEDVYILILLTGWNTVKDTKNILK